MTTKAMKEEQNLPELLELAKSHPAMIGYPEAAKLTGSSVRTLKRLTAAGDLPCYRVGRARVLRVRTADVVALVQRVA
jgi:excisionase family DNA binding protein